MNSASHRPFLPPLRGILVLSLLVLLMYGVVKGVFYISSLSRETGITPQMIGTLLTGKGSTLKQTDNRTNILLLGIGGGEHAGAKLTDTIMVASISHTNPSIALVSVPRDLWSETLKDKINSAYYYGEEKREGGGFVLASSVVEEVVGMPIHYTSLVDFSGFTKLIDVVDGVDVEVASAFTDPTYPVEGKENDLCNGDKTFACRYESLHFDAGLQHMDGKRALMYVRSRHAEGDEGTDFARSRRQQEVLVALQSRLMSRNFILSRDKVLSFIAAIDATTETNMTMGEILTLVRRIIAIRTTPLTHVSIEDHLEVPPLWMYSGRYVLVPAVDYNDIHVYIQSKLQ